MVEKRVNDRKNGQRQNGYGDESADQVCVEKKRQE
jgi:hypothetical protein